MDFSIDAKTQSLISKTREFVAKHVRPLEPLMGGGWDEVEKRMVAVRATAKELGLWTPQRTLPLGEFALLSEELGRSPLGHYAVNCQAPDVGNMELLEEFGSEEQKKQWLEPLASGSIRSCFSMTEPEHAGSNPVWMSTRAELRDGAWVINGHKWFTSAADGAKFAVVMAVTDPDAGKYMQASMILVPTDNPGFRLVRNIPVMGHAGTGWPTHGEVRYENCRVPESSLLGGRGAGFALAQERLGPGRIHHCMRWIGICERSLDLMCEHAARRELSPGKPLATRQAVQQWIAESRAEIDAARFMVLHAAWKMEREGQRAARVQISTIKFFVANTLQRVVDRAVQTLGGLGVTDDTPLAFWYRHERAARIYDGPDEVHKTVVARRVLRGYGVELK
ncbi:MAG TPA: acyl-CoA dehydrogenase family protein [Myxococcales bacterium]|nr:acyl-CoA dehydrogenase family protein [Myxococcales bacterium]